MTRFPGLMSIFTVVLASTAALSESITGVYGESEPAIIVYPLQDTAAELSSGCWIQFYTEQNFQGDVTTWIGPSVLTSLNKGTDRLLRKRVDSLRVGPNATLTTYEHAIFKDRSTSFEPGRKEGELRRTLELNGRIESMTLDCVN